MAVKVGDPCPDFSLKNQLGKLIQIKDFIGKKILVIYFYPKDETSGCTAEACSFRDAYEEFKLYNCEIFGISTDSVESHKEFAENHHLSFYLLSDPEKEVRELFGVKKNLFGLMQGRVTFIIDKKGIVRSIHNSWADPVGHIYKALKVVKEL
jgi:peroxiredoxin Q/BCP